MSNGSVFEGNFEEDSINGEGLIKIKDKEIIIGEWLNNKLIRIIK